MQTLQNLLSAYRPVGQVERDLSDLLSRYGVKPKLDVPGDKSLALPRDPDGLKDALTSSTASHDVVGEFVLQRRLALIYEPTFVLPLVDPTTEELSLLGASPKDFRNQNPRAFCTGIVTKAPSGEICHGVARIIAIENGIRMGRTWILSIDDDWSMDQERAEERLMKFVQEAKNSVRLGPEPSDKNWRTLLALLGGRDGSPRLPTDWRRRMQLTAGLYQVNLDIRPNPESARAIIIAELKSRPPDGLLVWADWVAHPETFIDAYVKARPGAYAELLGRPDNVMSFDEHLSELQFHVRQLIPAETLSSTAGPENSWNYVGPLIMELAGAHFVLTSRAAAMIEGNPYPKPDRMLAHIQKLAQLALEFHEAAGSIGGRIADIAIGKYGIEIALFDASLETKMIEFDGERFNTQPHVKVDDYKTPNAVGRIYFAIDQVKGRFIVDHIGLHDYK